MAINRTTGFEAVYRELTLYNRKAVLNLVFSYYLPAIESDYDLVIEYGRTNHYYDLYPFTGYTSSFLYIYDSEERNTLIKSFAAQVTRNANNQVLNASVSDMTFDEKGAYWYEIGYVRSGYEVVLNYGKLFIE
jgi:hypothetical protein